MINSLSSSKLFISFDMYFLYKSLSLIASVRIFKYSSFNSQWLIFLSKMNLFKVSLLDSNWRILLFINFLFGFLSCEVVICFWDDFSINVASFLPISSSNYPTKAKRPYYSVLSKEKLNKQFQVVPRHWKEAVESVLS